MPGLRGAPAPARLRVNVTANAKSTTTSSANVRLDHGHRYPLLLSATEGFQQSAPKAIHVGSS